MSIEEVCGADFLSGDEPQRLRRALSLPQGEDLAVHLERLAITAMQEYKEMLLGSGLPLRIDEVRQRRLLHLIKFYYRDKIPTEQEVARVFQFTPGQAKVLIRAVLARYRHELGPTIQEMLAEPIQKADWNEDRDEYRIRISSSWVLDALNEMLTGAPQDLARIRRKPGTSSTYVLAEDSYDFLAPILKPHGE
jgi:hypothetical protein